jgi:hypothetical protein
LPPSSRSPPRSRRAPVPARAQNPNQAPVKVTVVNTEAAPVPVRDVNARVSTPVQIDVDVFLTTGDTATLEDVYVVPDGMRLVIEHVSLKSGILFAGNTIEADVITRVGGLTFLHPLDFRPQTAIAGPHFVANHPALAYAEAGTQVTVAVQVKDPQALGVWIALRGTVSGHLESAQ